MITNDMEVLLNIHHVCMPELYQIRSRSWMEKEHWWEGRG